MNRARRGLLLIGLFLTVLAVACAGAAGPQGPQGPAGDVGPQGPPGPAVTQADKIVKLVTLRSDVDPFAGHEEHQLTILLPPDSAGRVFTGTLSYSATKPVELIVIFPYNPPGPPSAPHGELGTVAMEDQPFAFTVIPTGQFATVPFSGVALALHTLNGEPFEVSASIHATVEDLTATE